MNRFVTDVFYINDRPWTFSFRVYQQSDGRHRFHLKLTCGKDVIMFYNISGASRLVFIVPMEDWIRNKDFLPIAARVDISFRQARFYITRYFLKIYE